jgi:hypothetical protein
MRCIGIVAVIVGLLMASAGQAAANVAPCDKAVLGSGPPDWKQRSLRAGPVGVFEDPLGHVSRTKHGLVAKMPMVVEGQAKVTVSVPPALRKRVFLYYGNVLDRQGHPTTSFQNAVGNPEVLFEPCAQRPRTPWPGGIRILGTKPVHLTVRPESGGTYQLRLGRPRLLIPS